MNHAKVPVHRRPRVAVFATGDELVEPGMPPAPGQIVLYPGGISETEILLAYGGVHFACKMGQLAGNHFITIASGLDDLAKLGKMTLWQGAQKIRFERP